VRAFLVESTLDRIRENSCGYLPNRNRAHLGAGFFQNVRQFRQTKSGECLDASSFQEISNRRKCLTRLDPFVTSRVEINIS
jgi:hypothetical protein